MCSETLIDESGKRDFVAGMGDQAAHLLLDAPLLVGNQFIGAVLPGFGQRNGIIFQFVVHVQLGHFSYPSPEKKALFERIFGINEKFIPAGNICRPFHFGYNCVMGAESGRLDLSGSITGRYPLERAAEALDDLANHRNDPVRLALIPGLAT